MHIKVEQSNQTSVLKRARKEPFTSSLDKAYASDLCDTQYAHNAQYLYGTHETLDVLHHIKIWLPVSALHKRTH